MSDQYVLIDNDPLIRKSWEYQAQKTQLRLSTFSNVDDFLAVAHSFDINTKIFIDSDLDDGKLGEIEAAKIHALGFTSLVLATGKDLSTREVPGYIIKIISKRAPF